MSIGRSISIDSDGKANIDVSNETPRKVRKKGTSLIETPSNYTVIDIETTGLDPKFDEIIEIGAIKVRNNTVVETFESLIKPNGYYYDDDNGVEVFGYVDDFITNLTGITNEMLKSAPSLEEVLPQYIDFIKNDIVLGNNVHFDINFLYDVMLELLDHKFSNNLVDLLRLSRRVFPEFKNHKLETVATNLDVDISNKHRSLRDCEITLQSFTKLTQHLKENDIDLKKLFAKKGGGKTSDLTLIKSENESYNEDHLLYKMNCVFTGKLEKMDRKDAAQLVVDLGGKCLNGVTKKANFLILGNFDYNSTIKDGKSSKLKRAEKLILEGQDLQILSEDVFYDLVLDN